MKVVHKPLPFGSAEFINNHIKFKIKKKDLVFLTIPTPKQEQIAEFLKEKNKHYKIICIGGSIGIVAGDEKVVPKSLFYLEFLWRLRYETFRRLKRLIITFYQYLTDMLFYKKLQNIKIKFINKKKFLMNKILNNNIILKLFILFSWSILWLSINSMPGEISYMKENFISFINGSRTILAIIVSFLSVIILFISLKKKKLKKSLVYFNFIFIILYIPNIWIDHS